MDRFIDGIELAAEVFIGIVALDVFVTVVLRYFGVAIPDSYDFGQLLLGHRKLESTVRYLGIEVDDALEMSEQIDL